MNTPNRPLLLTISITLLTQSGCGLIGVRPDETNDPSIDPIVRAAAQVRAEHGGDVVDVINPEAASEQRIAQEELKEKRIHSALRSGDVVLGMSTEEVEQVWGEPRDIETAGDPRSGNQRWVYFDGLSSRWSMSAKRIVYFERGHVIGWEQER